MIKQFTLNNGLRVVMEMMPSVRSVSFGIWVKNGSRNESARTNGISHFIEHMLFKGTETRTAKDIADTMDAVGGQINAFTSKEYTCYYTRTLDTHFDVALDVLTDMFFRSRFDENEIKKERNVILEEINMFEDTPDDLVHDILQYAIWPNDPLGQSILGTAESIGAFTHDSFVGYFGERYSPENTVVAVAGNFDENIVLEKLNRAFEPYKPSPGYSEPPLDAGYAPAFIVREKDIEQVHLCVSFPGIPFDYKGENYAIAAVNTIFGGGMSSRLFQKIREERGLAYTVYAYATSYADTGLFTVYTAMNPSQVNDVFRLIIDETKRMFTERVTEEQLNKAREQLKSNYLLSLESSANRMNSIGRSMLMLNRTFSENDLIERLDAVNMETFYDMCERVFQPDKLSVSMVGRNLKGLTLDDLR